MHLFAQLQRLPLQLAGGAEHLRGGFARAVRNVAHLFDHPRFELLRHDITMPLVKVSADSEPTSGQISGSRMW